MSKLRSMTMVCALATLAWSAPALASNPIVTDIYTADPDAFVVGDRFYIDTDQDEAPLGASDFLMRTWHMYSSTDAEHWTNHGTLLSLTDFPWANRNAWAPEMVQRDGKFYWYLPMQKAATNSMSIGVAVGDSPTGPFHDALGKPLIDNTTANHSSFDIDPTVLVDDDGQAYIYWGSFSSPRVAKLKDNMVELQELGTGGGDRHVAGKLATRSSSTAARTTSTCRRASSTASATTRSRPGSTRRRRRRGRASSTSAPVRLATCS